MSNASVKLVMRPSKRRADGTAPIYLRAIHARRSREAATGVCVEPKHWNAAKQEVRRSHPLWKSYNAKLEDQLLKAKAAATRARSAADVIAGLDGRSGSLSAFMADLAPVSVNEEAERRRIETTARKLHAALGEPWPGGSIPWEALTPAALDRFARYCRTESKNNPNTVRKELVRLRAVCSRAVKAGALRPELDPFVRYTLPKGQAVTRRRLTLGEVGKLLALDLEPGTRERVVRDAFAVAFFGHGVRISDLLLLTRDNVVEEGGALRLRYRMQKTRTPLTPKLPPVACDLLRPYVEGALPGRYVFPLMQRGDDGDAAGLRRRQNKATTKFNKALKRLGERAGIGRDGLSSHTARHSYADHARQAGDLYALSKSLGHKDLRTTEAYINSFDRAAVDALSDSLWDNGDGI